MVTMPRKTLMDPPLGIIPDRYRYAPIDGRAPVPPILLTELQNQHVRIPRK
jgi:hypothetical protein